MSLNKPPSYVGIDERKITVAFLETWYDSDRCDDCPQFKKRAQFVRNGTRTIAYCELIEKDEPCEVTGIRHVGEKDWR